MKRNLGGDRRRRSSSLADRHATKIIGGVPVAAWFTEDFTRARLNALRARERLPQLPPGSVAWRDKPIATFEESLALLPAAERSIGTYPETKHPTYFQLIGKPMERGLARAAFTEASDPAFLQSFEVPNLRDLRKMTTLRFVQLIVSETPNYDQVAAGMGLMVATMISPEGLKNIAAMPTRSGRASC